MPALLTFKGAPQFGQFRSARAAVPLAMRFRTKVQYSLHVLSLVLEPRIWLASYFMRSPARQPQRGINEAGPQRLGSRIFVLRPQHSSIHAWASLFLSGQEK